MSGFSFNLKGLLGPGNKPRKTIPMGYEVETKGDARYLERLFPSHNKDRKTFQSFWSSPEKMAEAVSSWNLNDAWYAGPWENENPGGFYGTPTMKHATDLAMNGWPAGVEKASRLLDKVKAENPMQLKPAKYGIAGSTPNVPRAIGGNPLNMRIPDPRKASRRPVYTLLSDMGATCGHGSDEFINRAAVVAALIDQIESAGYSCDVITYSISDEYYGGESGMQVRHVIQVKNSNQPVDIQRLAFGLGHPAMFRRLAFAERAYHKFNSDLDYGLGSTHRFTDEEKKELAEKRVFVIPSVNGNDFFKTEESSSKEGLQYLVTSLKDQGFPLYSDGTRVTLDEDFDEEEDD